MDKTLWLIFLVSVAMFVGLFALVFALAGTTHLPYFWAVFGLQAAVGLGGFFLVEPDLIKERIKPGGKDQDKWGPTIITILYLAHISWAALDVGRLHLSDQVGVPLQSISFGLYAIGVIGMLWTMRTNQFFSSAVRIQDDRGQHVISSGPYAVIRHPGYSFASILFFFEGLALGSYIATIPALILIALLIRRTFMEEKMLTTGLQGYEEYTHRVRYRWIPGVW